MNQMHIPPQFRNQMPFNMPPPGGIPYMVPGYPDPFGMNNMPGRFIPPSDQDKNKTTVN
jgi:hypothetical protein